MNFIRRLFRTAPHIPEIEDEGEVKKLYGYWRLRILYSMFAGYALYYFTRKSFNVAMPGLIAEFDFTKAQTGILMTIAAVTYGISKFTSGIISDRANPRFIMAVGLLLTGVFNIFFGFSSSLILFALFWGLNGWFQGFGWPPCARLLTHWYSQSERGSWWSTWNVSHNVGAFLIPIIAGACLHYFGWRYAMLVPGAICILGAFFLFNRLRDTPQSLGLPAIEKYRNDYVGVSKADIENKTRKPAKEILFEYVLKNKIMWLLAVAYFFIYVVRAGIDGWTTQYMLEEKGYTTFAPGFISIFEAGGFCGSLCAGWSSDYLFEAKRGPVNVLFSLGTFCAILAFWFVPPGHPYLDSICLFLTGFCIFGPQLMIGMAAAELSHKEAAATATGFVGFIAYIGAAFAGYPLGKITQEWGWEGFFWALTSCCAISVVALLPLWGIKENKRKVPAKAASVAEA